MQKNKLSGLAIATALALASCGESQTPAAKSENKTDILAANLDTTVNPADDFFQYAVGGWIKRTPIPGDETSWGIGQLVNEELYKRKLAINEEAASKSSPNAIERQVGDFWQAGMDSNAIEKAGIAPLQPLLAEIRNAKTKPELLAVVAKLHTYGVNAFFGEGVSQDAKNSDVMAYYISQGGLGLPNRDYYFKTDPRTTEIRDAYPKYIATILQLSGEGDSTAAKTRANAVFQLETRLASASRRLEDLRDPYRNYNKMSIGGVQNLAPVVDWKLMLDGIGVKNLDTVIVGQPEFYKALGGAIASVDIQILKDYLEFQTASTFAPYLSKPFVDANFNFYSATIRGADKQRPRWKRVLDAEERTIGEEVGQLFAKEYFDEKAKKRYSDMVELVRNAYKLRIEKLEWMNDTTKEKALHKLATMKKKVGYPDKWKDFSGMRIGKGSYAGNIMNANQWWNQYSIDKLGKPVDRDEWDMTPQTYNAYYNPSNNEIVLPAGIFTVPGYRDEELDDALVFGYAAASTIGHEITHGFDDEGRQFDAQGNLKNWWTRGDSAQFARRSAVLVKQFNGMIALDTLHLNGSASLGENLADLGGILLGLDAFKQTETYRKNELISGLNPLQRYFLGYSLGWMYQIKDKQLASQILTDVHAPAKFRVNGPFPNVPEFYQAFNVKPGSKMYLADSSRVVLW